MNSSITPTTSASKLSTRLVLFSVLATGVGQSMTFTLLAPLGREVGLGEVQVGLIISCSSLAFTLTSLVWGRASDRWGRKPLQITGALGMAFFMIVLGFTFFLEQVNLVSLICMLGYVACFALSWGPVTWVLLSEIFPNRIRGRAMALAVAAMWVSNLIISLSFPILNNSSGLNQVFNHGFAYWIYGIMGILAALFVRKYVPETKGRSLEEIENQWKKPGN